MDITSAAIATLISSGISSTIALLINRQNKIRSFDDQLDSIIKISIQYPYLENPCFTETWDKNKASTDEMYVRYENYCILVFNFMERLCKYYNYDEDKIKGYVNMKDWVRIHRGAWLNPSIPYENSDGYEKKFKQLMESYLK